MILRVMLKNYLNTGLADFNLAFKSFSLWLYLGFFDVKSKYRRSILGPWWLTLSTLTVILMLGFLWSKIFNQPIHEFLPYFGTGYIFWLWMSSQVLEASNGFGSFSNLIRQQKISYFGLILRLTIKNFLILCHNSIIILFLILFLLSYSDVEIIYFKYFLFFIGLGIVQISLFFFCYIVATICTRYADFGQIVGVIVQLVFFFTPIIWQVESIKSSMMIIDLNPIYHLITIIRDPLLGKTPFLNSYYISISMMFIFGFLAMIFSGKYNKRISFWI